MTCKLKSVLKIRNKGISGLPLKSFFPVPFLLHNIFRYLEICKRDSKSISNYSDIQISDIQIRRYIKKIAWGLFDFYYTASRNTIAMKGYLYVFKKTHKWNHLSRSSQQTMFTFSAFLHFAHLQDSSRSNTTKQEQVLYSMVCIFTIMP